MDQQGKVVLRKTLKRAQLLPFIAPLRKGGKNDNNDAEAICEAAAPSTSWFVPVKTSEQQAQLCAQRVNVKGSENHLASRQ